MNVERCVELHNEILRHGWTHSGHDLAQFETAAIPWYSCFYENELRTFSDLVPELRQFLQEARMITDVECYNFFFWVSGPANLEYMFEFEEMWECALDEDNEKEPSLEYEKKRYILLYPLNQLASHQVGLL